MSAEKTIECLECHKDVKPSHGKSHAVTHWGDNLKKVCEANPDAAKRIHALVGDDVN